MWYMYMGERQKERERGRCLGPGENCEAKCHMTRELFFLLGIPFSCLFNLSLPRNAPNYIFILFSPRNCINEIHNGFKIPLFFCLEALREVNFHCCNLFFCSSDTLLPFQSISIPDPTHSSLLFNFWTKMWSQVFLQLNMNHIWIFPWKHLFSSVLLGHPETNESLEGWPVDPTTCNCSYRKSCLEFQTMDVKC